jgi:hypothetical protein
VVAVVVLQEQQAVIRELAQAVQVVAEEHLHLIPRVLLVQQILVVVVVLVVVILAVELEVQA